MKQRMFGSRNIPKVAKYAVVIYKFTRESKYDCNSLTAQMKAKRMTRKMCLKMIKRIKGSKYDFDPGKTNILWSKHLEHALKDKFANESYMFGSWMLTVNQFMHEVIHEYAQDYDPNDTESKKCNFFQEIFEELKTN